MKLGPNRLLAALLGVQIGALVWGAHSIGVTVDEPAHVLSSCLYWKGQDNLLPRDMPPLIKIVGGWVPCAMNIPIPYDAPAWKARHEWEAAQVMMERIRPRQQIQRLFFLSRLPLLIFPVLTALLIFAWMRQLAGPWIALLAAALFAFEPTSLGHGSLFKNDHAATTGFLFFWYCTWRFWKAPSHTAALLVTLSVLLAVMAKLSMLILVLIAPAVLLARCVSSRGRYPATLAVIHGTGLMLFFYAGLLATSWFDIGFFSSRELFFRQLDSTIPNWAFRVSVIFEWIPAPRLYWEGVMSVLNSNSNGSPVYLLGSTGSTGSPFYFLVASAFKLPFTIQVLFFAGILTLFWDMSTQAAKRQTTIFLLVPPLLYASICSFVSLQLGIRLILPVFPFLAMVGAHSFVQTSVRFHIAGVLLLLRFSLQTIRYFPYGISFFNLWAGGPENGIHYLADSNIDWGQDLPSLNRWYRSSGVASFSLFYFGNDQPQRFFTESECKVLRPPWDPERMPSDVFQPSPGYYAVSVNMLPGHFFDERFRDYFRAFRGMKPLARAGHSILIYRVDQP